ncbi:MAG: dihydrodipicolinate synthase family protein [Chloroflexota bacterium]|nr:dihydrodipicolinate synthase family protein [Caldilinea sp.]GIK75253.1 MAG: dihydrodipicolinate synthase family protein [Chloroflexota bacterium]
MTAHTKLQPESSILDRETAEPAFDPILLLRPRRTITGISAILLPFLDNGEVDWVGFEAHVARTLEAGLAPAVNMDTGYVNLLDDATRQEALARTQRIVAGREFVAGAFVADQPGAAFNRDAYARQIEMIQEAGGVPVIFQSFGLTSQPSEEIVAAYASLGALCEGFIAFELGTMFAPFGKIYDIATYAGLLDVPQCIGAKHSSLSRMLEWERLQLRDAQRPDFKVFTGNDLAIDMVMYGSDYLLGLSTFAPDLFARRDAMWTAGDPGFYELNDLLQYLGFFAFRRPVPAYKHNAAQFLKLRGWIASDAPHPRADRRPESDVAILRELGERLGVVNA